jgi:lipoprotein-anchoring transpeptidase ErfK/SrfK
LSTNAQHVARSKKRVRRFVCLFNRSWLAVASAATIAFMLATPIKPAAAQGWNPYYYEVQRPRLKVRAKPRAQAPVPEQASKEPFGQIRKGPLQIVISIDQQKLHLYSDGAEVTETLVATGVPGHPTPVGVFSIIQKDRLHHSNIYSGAPMPYMQRITWSGVALHEGGNLGHPASHGCVRLPHDFATRLWVLTKLGARVVIARPELRPEEFSDPHLFVHRDMSQAVPTASLPAAEQPIKTAQSLPEGKTSDAPAAGIKEPKEPVATNDAGAPNDKHDGAAPTPVADIGGAGPLRPSITDSTSTPATAESSTSGPSTSGPSTSESSTAASSTTEPSTAAPASEPAPAKASGTADAPQPTTSPTPVALPAIPVPPIKPAEIAHAAPKTPISIFISGKEKKIYVRQDFQPLFSAPVTIDHPEQRLGTHVFTALSLLDDHAHFRWNVISLPGEQARAKRIEIEARAGRGKQRNDAREAADVVPSPQSAKEALARIDIPQDIIDRISDLMIPGSSLVISDQGLGGETGEGTDFIVTMR